MTVFVDIIGSWLVRASLMIVMLTLTVNMNDAVYSTSQDANAKGLIVVVDSVIYEDVKTAGYLVSKLDDVFKTATATDFRFEADIDNNGSVDQIKYLSVYDSTTKCYTLSRAMNSQTPIVFGNKFTDATFRYYTASGTEVRDSWDYSKIRQIVVNLSVKAKNVTAADSVASSQISIYPPNLL